MPLPEIQRSTSGICQAENDRADSCKVVTLQQAGESKIVVASRSLLEREKHPDRICLDKRALTTFPWIVDEPKLRLISLQHNSITRIEKSYLAHLTKLVFLDLYDNQIDKFCHLDPLENLRVLLMGKNKIKKIEGLKKLSRLEVLDLHGNQITQVSGLQELGLLKVLNLAGNNIRSVGCADLQGLVSLRELNLKRNKIRKLHGLENTPQLQKLHLSNNEIKKIEDMSSVTKAPFIRVVSLDGNPVALTPDCVAFLVSYLPNLQVLSAMQVNEQVRKNALAWRTAKEQSDSAFLDLSAQVCGVRPRHDEATNITKQPGPTTTCLQLLSPGKPKGEGAEDPGKATSKPVDLSSSILTRSARGVAQSRSRCPRSRHHQKPNRIRSSVSDGGHRGTNHRPSELDFKLPPILAPIIDNLTRSCNHHQQLRPPGNKSRGGKALASDCCCGYRSSDSSDVESSSESHRSLKSALRSHLVRSSGHSVTARADGESVKSRGSFDFCPKLLEDGASGRGRGGRWTGRESHRSSISKSSSLDSGNKSLVDDSSSSTGSKSSGVARVTSAPFGNKPAVHYRSNRAATARAKRGGDVSSPTTSPPTPLLQPLPIPNREQGGDYLLEIVGRCLNVYGQGALRFIDSPRQWDRANDINLVKFNYVHFNSIAVVLNKLKKKFPNAVNFEFKETNICHVGQLNALAEAQGLGTIHIEHEGNPIMTKNWIVYAIFRLGHWGLHTINGMQITEENMLSANQEYSGLVDIVMWALPDDLLQPLLHRLRLERVQKHTGEQMTAKEFLFSCDSTLRSVVSKEALQWRRNYVTQEDLIWRHKGKIFFSSAIEQTVQSIEKLKILDKEWPNILREIVYDTLGYYSNMNDYMKSCIKDLENNK
ncbi:leucine-rich repeat-containing protein 49-like [Copidosoma floridanum]|uniref:leucine-rich repeat-containing protein 49-like n=1 Tax=Copidosoma floridanum TaxID=29053 RepID=UPI0006C9E11B|nr:leucine-rich repeat-containing protein 49-like [Copidosoma floridanum]